MIYSLSGTKSVKKEPKNTEKKPQIGFPIFFALANLKYIISYNLRKKVWCFRTYFFPLGEVDVSFLNLLSTALSTANNNFIK